MQIQTLKELKNTFLVNNELSVPKDSSNTDYQIIQKYIAGGGSYEFYDYLDELKNEKLTQVKNIAASRILAIYPDYKQRNINGAVSLIQNKELVALKSGGQNYAPTEDEMVLLRAAKACKEFIDAIRAKSNELEVSLDSMTEEQLNAFDPSEDSNWE